MKIWIDNSDKNMPEGYVYCSDSISAISKILESENEFGYYYRHRDSVDLEENNAREILITEINIGRNCVVTDLFNWINVTNRSYDIKYHSDDIITFNIQCSMNKRWVDHFCSMLEKMEHNGNIGHTEWVTFMSDGDGDFRPKFKIDCLYDKKEPVEKSDGRKVYDAG